MRKLFLLLSVLFVVSCSKDPIIYTLTTSANPSEGGTVSPVTKQYKEGKIATVTAYPNSEYVLQSWSGAQEITSPINILMNSDKLVTANFIKKQYPLTVEIEGEGTVTEKVIKAGSATDYNSGTIVELTAFPKGEWEFKEWKGDLTGIENPKQITIDKAKSVSAVFTNPTTNDLIEFSLLKNNNPILEKDLVFDINENNVYKYIPDFLNAKNLIATFRHNGKSVTVENIIQISDSLENNFNKILHYHVESINGEVKRYTIRLDSFTKLPVILINTENESDITSKEEYVKGELTFIGKDYQNPNFSKSIKIRGRGNFTWQQPKKPFQIKFNKKVSLLDMPEDKKWIFLANFVDKSMSRTAIAFQMGYLSNLDWTAKSEFSEVFLNNKYIGTYQISEKVEEDNHRVNIGENGYLLEVDQIDKIDDEDVYFKTPRNILFNIKSPDIILNSDEYNYIKNYISDVENILYAQNFDGDKLKKFIDTDSFVEFYLINEISKNNDAAFWSSTYLTLKPGEKLKMGPIWDFDVAFGNININENWLTSGWHMKKNSRWIKMMFRDEIFIKKVKERFNYFYGNKDRILNFSNELSKKLHKSRYENDKVWKTLGYYYFPQYAYDFSSFKEEHQYLNNWITERFEWLKSEIKNL